MYKGHSKAVNRMGLVKKLAMGTGLVVLLSTVSPSPVNQKELRIPKEPMSREKIVSMYFCAPSKTLMIEYDLDGDGKVDYITGRMVYPEGIQHVHLVAAKKPVIYYVDFNKDGHFDGNSEVFGDEKQDDVNGNEVLYPERKIDENNAERIWSTRRLIKVYEGPIEKNNLERSVYRKSKTFLVSKINEQLHIFLKGHSLQLGFFLQ